MLGNKKLGTAMTVTPTPPELPGFGGLSFHSYFFLGVDAITMAVDGLDVIHTAVADSGLFIEFAPFLILPTGTCTAA